MPDDKLVIATTGAQGEPMAGLARMANRDHRFVEIQPGDTVIVSASPIPGNEEYVSRTIDNLFKAGANVYYHTIKRAHVSGHASQEELKLMLGLTKPKHFIPMHGEFRMQVQHGRLAIETGVEPENVFIIENGTPIEIDADGSARRGSPVTAGYVYVDGLSVGDVGDVVLRDRRALASDGIFMIVVTVDKQTGVDRRAPRDHHPRLRPPERARPDDGRGARARRAVHRYAGRPHQRDRPAQDARSRTASRATCTSRPSDGRWSSPSSSRSERGDAPTARPRARLGARAGGGRGPTFHMPVLDDEIIRTLVGITLLIVGVVTLIGLALPSQGKLTDWWRDSIAPWFGSLRLLFPFILLACGLRGWSGGGRRPGGGGEWSRRSWLTPASWGSSVSSGTRVSSRARAAAASGCSWPIPSRALITVPGTFVVLLLVGVAALALALDRPLRALFAGPLSGAKEIGVALLGDRPAEAGPGKPVGPGSPRRRRPPLPGPTWRQTAAVAARRRSRSVRHPARPVPGTTAMARSRLPCRPQARTRRPSRRREQPGRPPAPRSSRPRPSSRCVIRTTSPTARTRHRPVSGSPTSSRRSRCSTTSPSRS